MIIKSYYELATAIKEQVPAILWRDIDKDQLEQIESGVIVGAVPHIPFVLFKFSEINWQQLGAGRQHGYGTVTLKLAIYLTDTHDTSPLMATNLDNMTLATDLHAAVDKISWTKSRTGSDEYKLANLWIIEQTYEVCLTPDPPNYRIIEVPVEIDLQLITNLQSL